MLAVRGQCLSEIVRPGSRSGVEGGITSGMQEAGCF